MTTAIPPAQADPHGNQALPPVGGGVSRDDSARARILRSRAFEYGLTPAAFFLIFVGYTIWVGTAFADPAGRVLNIHTNATILILGFSAVVTLIGGAFDLSIASMATLTTFLSVGLRVKNGWSFPLDLLACLAVGALGGLLNALLVVRLRIHAFIATLATGGIFLGFSDVYGGGTTLNPATTGPQLPTWFSGVGSFGDFGAKAPSWVLWVVVAGAGAALLFAAYRSQPTRFSRRKWTAICAASAAFTVLVWVIAHMSAWLHAMSWTVAWLFALATVLWVLLRRMMWGRHLYAAGSNPEAARLAGVPVERVVGQAFILGGVLAALAGVVLGSYSGAASQGAAIPFLLPAFACAFLSTVIFSRGQFGIWGALIGGIFLAWINEGLVEGGLAYTWTEVMNGAVLVLAVALSSVRRQRA